jgi:outer membrane protein
LRFVNAGDSTLAHQALHAAGRKEASEGLAHRGVQEVDYEKDPWPRPSGPHLGHRRCSPALLAAMPAHAADAPEGKWQVKLLATGVLADGNIDTVRSINPALASMGAFSAQTTASNNVTPTLALESFVKPNISIETIAGISDHHRQRLA